ncbi:MAG: SurA N-terminal domain-containing protein [Glaciecola sp.]|nr:SurA N-terminal domain-containing protein [Glaciecola sp.]MDG2100362.1 SurA N-terminal domain-containing protein [Glaciecola sp.]
MLERMREGLQGPWAMIIVALIVLSFVFAGVGSYLTAPVETAAAKVNGEDISARALDQAYQNERGRLESQFGEGISSLFANPDYLANFRQGVLDRLIADKLVEQKAQSLGLRVSDAQIKETIVSMPEFQVGGTFNNDRYLAVLRQAGFQVDDFRNYMRNTMTKEQLSRALLATDFVVPAEVITQLNLGRQTRDAKYATIATEQFVADIELSDEQINNYYQTNIDSYDTQEQVSVAYVELDVADLLPTVTVTDAQLQEYYQFNIGNYRADEKRRVSHILIEMGDESSAALATMTEIQAKLAAGEDFAELAKEYSNDTFSAENGGDLEYVAVGDMDAAFDAAVLALDTVGEVTDVVETEFGLHLIKLTELVAEEITPFNDVVDEVTAAVKQELAAEEFFMQQQQMAELAFEVPDTLEEVAAALNKSVTTTELFTANSVPALLNNGAVLANAFSQEFIEAGLNSDVIELDDEHVIVMRVAAYEPQRTRALAEVQDQVEASLRAQLAQEAALAYAQRYVSAADADRATILAEQNVSLTELAAVGRTGATDIDQAAVEVLFTLSQANAQATVTLPTGDVAIVELVSVNNSVEQDAALGADLRNRLTGQRAQSGYEAFVDALKADAEIVVLNN